MQTKLECTATLQLFVDGSYDPALRRGGWGFVVFREKEEIAQDFRGLSTADNGTVEVAAILHAVQWLAEHAPIERAIIWSDSVYAVTGCNRWRHIWRNNGWKKRGANGAGRSRELANAETWKAIDQLLTENPAITVEWCKGHSGIFGNERADALAELGRKTKA